MKRRCLTVLGMLLSISLVACTTTADPRNADAERGGIAPPAQPEPSTDSHLVPSAAERARAVELAARARSAIEPAAPPIAEARVTEEIVTAVNLYPPTDATDDRRLVAVTSFDYRTGLAARVVVDLSADRVVETKSLAGSAAPASPEEEARVRELLAADSPAYRELFNAPEESYDLALFTSTGDDGSGRERHRILLVRPVYFRSAPEAPIAIVDLTMEEVVRYGYEN